MSTRARKTPARKPQDRNPPARKHPKLVLTGAVTVQPHVSADHGAGHVTVAQVPPLELSLEQLATFDARAYVRECEQAMENMNGT